MVFKNSVCNRCDVGWSGSQVARKLAMVEADLERAEERADGGEK